MLYEPGQSLIRAVAPAAFRGRWIVLAFVSLVFIAAPWLGIDPYWILQLIQIAVLALIVSGLNLSYGYAGELSLGQVAMFAVGAYLTGYMALHGLNDVLLTGLCAGIAAMLIGLASGIPGLRLAGWSLAMVSFFLVLLIPNIVNIFSAQTGGYTGLFGIPAPKLLGHQLSAHAFYVCVAVTTIVSFAVMRNVIVSRHGNAFRVLRASPVLATSLGIAVHRVKLFAYAAGAVPAGIAGMIFAYSEGYVGPDTFSFSLSVAIIAASILGGAASVYGAVAGAILLQLGPLKANSFADYSLLIYGLFLLVGGVLFRGGIAGIGRRVAGYALRSPEDAVAGSTEPKTEVAFNKLPGQPVVAQDIRMRFGGNTALDDVSLVAAPGRITAVIGANGSGKTTFLNLVSGFLRPTSGRICIGDVRIDELRTHKIARIGVSRTFQTPIIPTSMLTGDVVSVARYVRPYVGVVPTVLRSRTFRRAQAEDRKEASRLLEALELEDVEDTEATQLPLGSRRLVELARALVTGPGVVLLDEPASGLERAEVERLGHLIRAVAEAGATVILVEHNFRFVMDLADDVYVLDSGRVISSGPPQAVEADPVVIQSYLGSLGSMQSSETVADAGNRPGD